MCLKSLVKIHKSNGFQLSLWYAVSFFLGSAILLLVTYILLASALKSQDQQAVQSELAELVSIYNNGGLNAVDASVSENYRFRKKNPFLIRVVESSNQTLKTYYPQMWREFDLALLNTFILKKNPAWIELPAVDGDFKLVATASPLDEGRWLQVGISTQEREQTLHRFRAAMLTVFLPVVFLGVVGGTLFALRSLRPVRNIVQTVQAILDGQLEARVNRSNSGDELDELARLFNEMLDKIKLLIESFKGSLDNVAHDLRTPMTRLRSVAEKALQNGADLESAREALSDCVEESDRILSMLTMLMDISEAETGALYLERRATNISVLLTRVMDMYEPVADEKSVKLTIDAPAELYTECDGNRLSQAFANLLDNAIKYTPAGGSVVARALHRNGELFIQVSDTGIGIPADDMPKIWDRLFRGDAARSQKGLGLGLSFVKAICEAHHGRVYAKSTTGQGAVFTIALPSDL
jgi:signal transduction histidine kinase